MILTVYLCCYFLARRLIKGMIFCMKHRSLLKHEKGQSMVEFALILPFLLLILCGIIDYGWLFYNQLNVNNACREAARFAVVNSGASDLTDSVNNKVKASLGDGCSVTLTFTDPSDKTNGDVKVTVDSDMPILTPVLGTINGSMTKKITSDIIMKVES